MRTVEQLRLEDYLGSLPVKVPVDARAEIVRLQAQGFTAGEISNRLNARKVPTSSGRGQWWPGTVRRAIDPVSWRNYIRRYRLTHPRTD